MVDSRWPPLEKMSYFPGHMAGSLSDADLKGKIFGRTVIHPSVIIIVS